MSQTEKRKDDHIQISLDKDIEYTTKTGLEDVELLHNSLPELNYNEIDTSTIMFDKKLSMPFMITAITGGTKKGQEINRKLAKIAQDNKIAIGLGSQRAMLENPDTTDTFMIRDIAPDVPIIGNIGISQLQEYSIEQISQMLKKTDCDAVAVHLNPLQEVTQPEGDVNFKGLTAKLKELCDQLSIPVIVKETGAGMSMHTAYKLKTIGVDMIDVSGTGGTSWSKVEYYRKDKNVTPGLGDWGIPTAVSVIMCSGSVPLIASGGIRSGIDIAKSIAIGADYVGAALPLLKSDNPDALIKTWHKQLKTVMFLTGSNNIAKLKDNEVFITGKTAQTLAGLGKIIRGDENQGVDNE